MRRCTCFVGFKSEEWLDIRLGIISEGADNDSKGMAAGNAHCLPFSTATGVLSNVDQITTQSFFQIDFILQFFAMSESITSCLIVDKVLNTCGDLFYDKASGIILVFTPLTEPIHQELAYSLKHREDWHFASGKESGIE